MEGLLWLLIWAALFYFMMRFGCGAHMVHRGQRTMDGEGGGEHASALGVDAGRPPKT
jgi:hypothetical protein